MANSTTNLDTISSSDDGIEARVNESLDACSPAFAFGRHGSACAALNFAIYGGVVQVAGVPTVIGNQSFALTASTTNYLRRNADGSFTVIPTTPPAGWPGPLASGAVALYAIVTGTATVTSYTDYREAAQRGADGAVVSVVAGANITVDATDPANPIVASTGGGSSDFLKLSQVVTSASQTTVDFTSISGAYSELRLVWKAQCTTAGTSSSTVRVRINNDSTSGNYLSSQRIGGQTGASFASAIAASAGGAYVGAMPNAGNTSIDGTGEVTLVGYAGTTMHKRIRSFNEYDEAVGNTAVYSTSRWKSTAAIDRVTFTTDGAAILDGSVFTLYGIN